MSRYRIEVTGNWAGAVTTHGWRPALGEESTFGSRDHARAAFEAVVLPELPEGDDARNWAPRFRLAELDGDGEAVSYETL